MSGSQPSSKSATSGMAQSHKPAPHEAVLCTVCNKLFGGFEQLMGHKRMKMLTEGSHIHCSLCTRDFNSKEALDKHLLEAHPQEQNLICPGCQKTFVRLAGWMRHLEHNECPAIRRADVDQNRVEKLTFSHELEKRSGSQFGDYFPVSHPSVLSAFEAQSTLDAQSDFDDKAYMAHPSFFKPKDFPELKDVKDSLESIQRGAAQPDTSNEKSREPVVDDINNPSHPLFDPRKYYNAINRKFKKTFPSSGALIGHMKSAASHYNAKLQCPGCLRYFKDASSLTAHSESESTRCSIRKSENYRSYLDQLTGGMADVGEKHGDGTIKYEVSTEAVIKFAPTRTAKSDAEDFMAQPEADRQEKWARNNIVW
ncbi:C2H2 type zinc finger containing protein [Colletotrichum orchidophilum]|uniref:C2H2 type zinc finger containing protein n=1 Tax=Colletotrichum orchidophilum TaxID=1209926 RepID=A0A1G4BMZ5_9PEZI|nr:C2H2 type zinc finger containing protein [Colletotrichum orchidophilum]OHF02811.1 C2H2 type zinc finger containing protein [Colletotrichum orchidophilum]